MSVVLRTENPDDVKIVSGKLGNVAPTRQHYPPHSSPGQVSPFAGAAGLMVVSRLDASLPDLLPYQPASVLSHEAQPAIFGGFPPRSNEPWTLRDFPYGLSPFITGQPSDWMYKC